MIDYNNRSNYKCDKIKYDFLRLFYEERIVIRTAIDQFDISNKHHMP